jgi:N-acetylmuramoyl-L-alanine amidase
MPMSNLQRCRVVMALSLVALTAHATPSIGNARYSPRDGERPRRPRTDYIILHTTEAPAPGSYRKLLENGEAHFLVDRDGAVYTIMRREKLAYHAGISMWNGRKNIDNYSIGIEVVGYHTRSLTAAQYKALRKLLDTLKQSYGISDDRVLTHSMVAYGEPNRWHPRPHRGRKRCGMQFADPSVRLQLGLLRQPRFDPDVAARRLVVGDAYLASKLYPFSSRPTAPSRTPTRSSSR